MLHKLLVAFIGGLLIFINIITGTLLIQTILNTEDKIIATVVGYFAAKNHCFFNQWIGGAYVSYALKNGTCTTKIIFEDTCGSTENITISLVQKLHPLYSIIEGATKYNHCHLHNPRGILWLRAILFSVSVLLTGIVIVFLIKCKRQKVTS